MKSGKDSSKGDICKLVFGSKNKLSAWTSKSML